MPCLWQRPRRLSIPAPDIVSIRLVRSVSILYNLLSCHFRKDDLRPEGLAASAENEILNFKKRLFGMPGVASFSPENLPTDLIDRHDCKRDALRLGETGTNHSDLREPCPCACPAWLTMPLLP